LHVLDFVGDVTMWWVGLHIFGQGHWVLGTNAKS